MQKKNIALNKITRLIGLAISTASVVAILTPSDAMAVTFNVARTLTDGTNNASLTGTVDIEVGNYTLIDGSPNPFTAVNLTMTSDGDSYTLDTVSNLILGTGRFLINATSSTLTFNTENTDETNIAVLAFTNSGGDPIYSIGVDDHGPYEQFTGDSIPTIYDPSVSFPTVFGTAQVAIPEPITILGVATALGFGTVFKRQLKR